MTSKIISLIALITFCTVVSAHNNVVVIPLLGDDAAQNISNVVTVAKSGGDFTNIHDAIDSIDNATIDNPYIVLVGPGVYTHTRAIDVKPNISLIGSGVGVTILQANRLSSFNFINISDGSTFDDETVHVSDMTIQNETGQFKSCIGSENFANKKYVLKNLYIDCANGIGIRIIQPRNSLIDNVEIVLDGGSGIDAIDSFTLEIRNTKINIIGSRANGISLGLLSSNVIIRDTEMLIRGELLANGILVGDFSIELYGNKINVLGEDTATSVTGVSLSGDGSIISDSIISVETFNQSITAQAVDLVVNFSGEPATNAVIQNSQIIGNVDPNNELRCFSSNNGVADLDIDCQ